MIGGIHEPTDREVSGPQCPQCGAFGCGCEPDCDPRSWAERCKDEAMEDRRDAEAHDAAQKEKGQQ
jgi:hypothetical protein